MAEFGENLKNVREQKGYTQQTLADHLYVTRQAVSRWEGGSRYPDLMTAKKMAQFLEVSLDELVYDNLKKSEHVSVARIDELLADCTPSELEAICEVVATTKNVLRAKR